MSVTAAVLLFLSAIVHAGWNYLSKKDHPTLAFYLVANAVGVVCVLPVLAVYWPLVPHIPASVWTLVAVSGFFIAVYMAALAGAYRTGDISITYPVARSLPVVFVTGAAVLFGWGSAVSPGFIVGVLLIVPGCVLLPINSRRMRASAADSRRGYCMAVVAAVGVAGYTIADHRAIAELRALPASPFTALGATLVYMLLEAVSGTLWKGLFVLASAAERRDVRTVLAGFKRSAAVTGIGIYLTYGLVLGAMNSVTNASYVAVFRQLSIPIGAMLGMVVLKEPASLPKFAGLGLIFAGLVLASVV